MADFYGTWKEDTYVCDKCSWEGTGEQCAQGETFKDLFEINCPSCNKRVDVVLYPTIEESRANWDKVSDADKIMVQAREQFLKAAAARCLESPEQLPEIEGDILVFVWDMLWDDYLTVIRFGNKVIWREPAFYEGYERFEEVAVILKKKYGDRLKDLAPAQRSQYYLLGDCLSGAEIIERVRDCIRQSEWQDLPSGKFKHQTIEESSKVAGETPHSNKITTLDARFTQSLSGVPRLHSTKQLPEIYSDEDLVFVWDALESENSLQIVIRFGDTIIWKEFGFFQCYSRFEPIAMILQQKYGDKLKDLIPTRQSEINLYGGRCDAECIVGEVQNNILTSRYALNSENITNQPSKDKSDKSNSDNAKSLVAPISNNSKPLIETKPQYKVCVDDNFAFQDEPGETNVRSIYETFDEALRMSKKIIDDFLIANYKFGITADELYRHYMDFGDEPWIVPNKDSSFSAWNYAKEQCANICSNDGFIDKGLSLKVSVSFNKLHFGDDFSIDFQRTLRIPDDGKSYPLPPGLGTFPVCKVSDYADKVPPSWNEHGGVFIPMFQREALWLNFSGCYWKPNAVKVAVGKINALTGETYNQTLSGDKQDYMVCPPQPWLDGIKIGHGTVRQFIAMPLGMGYTVESQISGKEEFGGIQILVFAPKPGKFPEPEPSDEEPDTLKFAIPSDGYDMGIAAGGKLTQKIYEDEYGVETWDEENFGRVFVHIVNSMMFREITGTEPPPTPITAKTYAENDLPWFDVYDETRKDIKTFPLLYTINPVNLIDKMKGFLPQQDDESIKIDKEKIKKIPITKRDW